MEEIKKEIIEKVILIAVADQDTTEAEESLDELEELVKTAGAEVAARVIQVRETPHPGTYIGKGKIDEVNALLYGTDATGIVCDDELSPAQISNLEEALDTKVMDRTLIILDIFAKRAFTREGKIQVELAQLKYRSCIQTYRTGKSVIKAWRRNWNKRTGREETGDGPKTDPYKNLQIKSRVKRCCKAQRSPEKTTPEESPASGLYRWIYQCRKVNTIKPFYQCRSL